MMRLRPGGFVLSCLMLFPGTAALADDVDNRARLKDSFASAMMTAMGTERIDDLVASGLAEADAERIMAQLSEDASECLLVAAETKITLRGDDPTVAMDSLDFDELYALFESDEELEMLTIGCLFGALADAGLSAD